jgi:hypothetical protein
MQLHHKRLIGACLVSCVALLAGCASDSATSNGTGSENSGQNCAVGGAAQFAHGETNVANLHKPMSHDDVSVTIPVAIAWARGQ